MSQGVNPECRGVCRSLSKRKMSKNLFFSGKNVNILGTDFEFDEVVKDIQTKEITPTLE